MTRRKCKALRVRQAAVLFFKCDRQVYVLTITEMQGRKLDAVLASGSGNISIRFRNCSTELMFGFCW